MQLDQSENFFTDSMQVNLYVRSSKYKPEDLLWRSTFCKRDILSNHVKHKSCQTHMVAGDVEFVFPSRNERFKQIEIKNWNHYE